MNPLREGYVFLLENCHLYVLDESFEIRGRRTTR